MLNATLQVSGTVVGVTILHPPGSSHPGTGSWDLVVAGSQGSSVTFNDGAMEHPCGLCLVKPHIQQGGTLGRQGLQREGAHARGMGGQLGTPGLYSHRALTPSTEL